jgi:hypothetical protein
MSDEPQRPIADNSDEWTAYWTAQGMSWRTEPEIDGERQYELDRRRREIVPDIEKGVYPFKDIELDRADIEWLLATHQSMGVTGPVDWDNALHHAREGIDLRGAILDSPSCDNLPLARTKGGLSGTDFDNTNDIQKKLAAMVMKGGSMKYAHLEGAALNYAKMEGVSLFETHLEAAQLFKCLLASELPADLGHVYFDHQTRLDFVNWCTRNGIGPAVAGIHWNHADLTSVDWSSISRIYDEEIARSGLPIRKKFGVGNQLYAFERGVQAYRQLTIVLRSQGLNEVADRFAYRAQLLQRIVLRRQRNLLRYLGSLFLDLLSGYGYRPFRSLYSYIFTIGLFALLFWCVTNDVSLTFGWFTNVITWLGMTPPPPSTQHLQGYEAVVVSMTSFHGRGFFQPVQSPGDKVAILAAIEAFFGLLLEIVLIATFTQRFFAR